MSNLNMNQPAKNILTDMINNSNIKSGAPRRFTPEEIVLSVPRPADPSQPVNTEIDMTLANPNPEDGENTPHTLYYDRIDFYNVFIKYSAEFEFIDGMGTIYDVLDYINDRTGLYITEADVQVQSVSTGDFPRYVILAAKPESLIFRGQASLILTGENEAPVVTPPTDEPETPPVDDGGDDTPPADDPPADDDGNTTP